MQNYFDDLHKLEYPNTSDKSDDMSWIGGDYSIVGIGWCLHT